MPGRTRQCGVAKVPARGNETMNHKAYCRVSATLFSIVALAHLARLLNGWSVEVETVTIPLLVSLFGFIVTGALAVWGFRQAGKS